MLSKPALAPATTTTNPIALQPIDDKIHWITTTVNTKGGLNVKHIAEYPYSTAMNYGLNLSPFIVHLKTQEDLDKFMARLSKADDDLNYLFNIRSIDLTGGIFTNMNSVLEIFGDTVIFAHNHLMHLELDSIVICQILDVSHNLLETVKLSNCQMTELNLSYNNITEIALVDCTIWKLNVSHNKLKTFDWKHLPDEIRAIDASHNLLDICDIFGVTIEKLDVSYNTINKHPVISNCFIGKFVADSCEIETILFPSCMIGNLELCGNNLAYFPNPNADELPEGLSSLDLSANQLKGDLVLTRFTISLLDVGFNDLTSISLNQCSFYYFIASHNEINNMEYVQTGIVFLDLSHNRIDKLFPTFPRDVEVLIMSYNQLANFYVMNPIYNSIRKLDLANNKLFQIIWNKNWLSNVTDLQLDNNPSLAVSKIPFGKILNFLSVSKTKDNSTYEIDRLKTFAKRVDLEWDGNEKAKHRISYHNHRENEKSTYLQDVLNKEKAKVTLMPTQIQRIQQQDALMPPREALIASLPPREVLEDAETHCKQQITIDLDDRDFDDDAILRMQTIRDAKNNVTNVHASSTNPLFSDEAWDDLDNSTQWDLSKTKFWNTNYYNNNNCNYNYPPAVPVKQYSKPIPVTTRWTYEC